MTIAGNGPGPAGMSIAYASLISPLTMNGGAASDGVDGVSRRTRSRPRS
jgi:hypothetical protein